MNKSLKKYYLALDLKNDPKLIDTYKKYHKKVWPEILDSIRESGIENMEIYNISNRLFMIIETNDTFNFDKKERMDLANPVVQEWEKLMGQLQQVIPGGKSREKWRLLNKIFSLNE